MQMKSSYFYIVFGLIWIVSCVISPEKPHEDASVLPADTAIVEEEPVEKRAVAADIVIEKELLYDKHTLDDQYPYKDTVREFRWDLIREKLLLVEKLRKESSQWGILQNYKNRNGEAVLVKHYKRNVYKRIADTLGVERFQGVPLYLPSDTLVPEIYGLDGTLVRLLSDHPTFPTIERVDKVGAWRVPRKYLSLLSDTVSFEHVVFVDRTNQNITALEYKDELSWRIRSMNPATTGQYRPPYAQVTPVGIFVLQEKKARMIYLVDGSQKTGGFAPYASRFVNGAYIHGVPVNAPQTKMIEYSASLGTTPRSHMCVRNATSHAKFIYDWAPLRNALIFVLD